ncbi:fatty acid cis/trans isomerase [Psychrobium sp. MM17-31]|uniref:fatty acid cis/trans isomerase n=1 Tax=Psychrobium sp. MM17-31 TaxID=2917758 RepID=UPI001EF5840B|nr:fatty acid cis/trans isomerase [Psychrobium sp. MM17-31]MCG7530400.1 fatty acid cis/trans isomerase [Psychrobium sp. MM17-31]
MNKSVAFFLALFLGACAVIPSLELDKLWGPQDSRRYEQPVLATAPTKLDFQQDIKPILDNRCVVCHGCYDSPCQLNLASYDGLSRGASKALVYNGTRILAAAPSRLFIDAQTPTQWREKDFFPVLNERSPSGDREAGVMHRLLSLKQQQRDSFPLDNQPLDSDKFDFSLDRDQFCPTVTELPAFEAGFSHWGMPFGLPGLSDSEYDNLTQWIAAGAPVKARKTLADDIVARVNQWETFLNQDSLKAQLMARYIYEHWFLANLYFDDVKAQRTFFKLVRSRTPSGEPVDVIATTRPFDDPKVDRVYYRLVENTQSILSKTHMPYVLTNQRLATLKARFIDENYAVTKLPDYKPENASNPFVTFAQIPSNTRYRFMLEEARFTIMGFIKGPVCRGQIALNVINDHFWVVFVAPDDALASDVKQRIATLDQGSIIEATKKLHLPAESGSTTGALSWLLYADRQMDFLKAKTQYINSIYSDGLKPKIDTVWHGDNGNKNAALTIFRHYDTASVEHGLIGETPQTMWLISYPLLEQIHYLLVAGFDVYGNYGHQLKTRLFMDFLRMEGEFNFLSLLPKGDRAKLLAKWYQDHPDTMKKFFTDSQVILNTDTGIDYQTKDTYRELQQKLKAYLAPSLEHKFELAKSGLNADSLSKLAVLNSLQGQNLQYLAQTSLITVVDENNQRHVFSMLHNNAHKNVAELGHEQERRLPKRDTVTVVNGFIGAYPNVFIELTEAQITPFVNAVASLTSKEDYKQLLDRFAIRRTHPQFWQHSDRINQLFKDYEPLEHGLLDYNRLENK